MFVLFFLEARRTKNEKCFVGLKKSCKRMSVVRKSGTATSKNTLDTVAQHVSAIELVCARLANEADERNERGERLAKQTLEAVNAMGQSVQSLVQAVSMLLERGAAPPTNPPRGRTVDDLLKDGLDVLVQRLWTVSLSLLCFTTFSN